MKSSINSLNELSFTGNSVIRQPDQGRQHHRRPKLGLMVENEHEPVEALLLGCTLPLLAAIQGGRQVSHTGSDNRGRTPETRRIEVVHRGSCTTPGRPDSRVKHPPPGGTDPCPAIF